MGGGLGGKVKKKKREPIAISQGMKRRDENSWRTKLYLDVDRRAVEQQCVCVWGGRLWVRGGDGHLGGRVR